MHAIPVTSEYRIRRSFGLALGVHVLLLAFLWTGVSWQGDETELAEAEVWDVKVRDAAPEAFVTAPATPAKPVPAPPTPAVADEPEPEISTGVKEKKTPPQQAERIEKTDRKAAKATDAPVKKNSAASDAERLAKLQKLMAGDAKRIAGTGGAGTAPKSTGPGTADATYVRKVASRIRANTSFAVNPSLKGNPPVVYKVDLYPDGRVRSVTKRRSSGIAGFDDAVLHAISLSQPYPKDASGRVPSGFVLTHRPKD